eukprot:7388918-Prymnesium_polylepis.1
MALPLSRLTLGGVVHVFCMGAVGDEVSLVGSWPLLDDALLDGCACAAACHEDAGRWGESRARVCHWRGTAHEDGPFGLVGFWRRR